MLPENLHAASPDSSFSANFGEPHFSSACLIENVGVSPDAAPEAIAPVLQIVPRGTFAVAGIAVGMVVLGWVLTFFFLFLPRGPIG